MISDYYENTDGYGKEKLFNVLYCRGSVDVPQVDEH